MKKNFITKNLLYFNPNLIFKMKKEDITNDVVDIVVSKKIDMNLDINNNLKSNYYYLLKRIQYDSNIYLFFDKKFLPDEEYYNLFSEYLKRWKSNYSIIFSQYKDVLLNIDLEQTFGLGFCRSRLYSYFEDYESIPKFIKEDNITLFYHYFNSDKCFELYSLFIQDIDKAIVDKAFCEKVMDNIGLSLKNHKYIKDYLSNYLIKNKDYKKKIFDFILQNNSNLNIEEYEYLLDSEFYKQYYEIHPEKFNFFKYKLDDDDVLEHSNLVEHYLQRSDIDQVVLDYFSMYASGELYHKIYNKLEEMRKKDLNTKIDEKISELRQNKDSIKNFNYPITALTKEHLIAIADIMHDYIYPNNLEILWQNEYYVEKLIENNLLDNKMYRKFFDNYSFELKKKMLNYFKTIDKEFMSELFLNSNYDVNTYELVSDEIMTFWDGHPYFTESNILNCLNFIKSKNLKNKIEFYFGDKIDFKLLIKCNNILPDQIVNFQKDINIYYKNYSEEELVELITLISNSSFKHNININSFGINRDIIPSSVLEKIENILPGRITINSLKTIQDVIEIDKTLGYYVQSINDYIDRNGNLKKLSPYEKYIAIYTIVINYSAYHASNSPEKSRSIYEIINSDDQRIVCAGYVTLLTVLLNRVGIKSVYNSYSDDHARAMVRIDDDKYDIHTTFICDPTWDSVQTDDLSRSRGTYNYVHLPFDRISADDHVDYLFLDNIWDIDRAKYGKKLVIDKEELDKSLSEEKLVVGLANMERFVDKNEKMLSGIQLGKDISVDEYNEVALKYGRNVLIDKNVLEKIYTSPIKETLEHKNDFYDPILQSLNFKSKLDSYGLSINIDKDGNVHFSASNQISYKNEYCYYLRDYLIVFDFYNDLIIDVNKTWQEQEEILGKYVDYVIKGIPKEYCERYREIGTINIPFGDKKLVAKIEELPIRKSDDNVRCCDLFDKLIKYDIVTAEEFYYFLGQYLFNFNTSIDFNLFLESISSVNPDWKKLTIGELKQLASKYMVSLDFNESHKHL